MINKKHLTVKGFTLMETLVAVLLLSIAIAGPLTIASKGIQATTLAKDQDSAFYLAQDAIEYVRWARDTNTLGNTNWLEGTINLTPCVSTDGSASCQIDTLKSTISACNG